MTGKKIIWCGLLILVLIGVSLAGCQSSGAGKTIKIGALIDLTGPIGPGGIDMEKGIRLAVEQNTTIAGKTIELIVEDAASDAAISMDKVKKLVESDKVALWIGPINGGGGVAVAEYAEQVKVPQFAPLNASNDAAMHDYAYAPLGLDMQIAYGVGAYAADTLKYKTAVSLAADFVPGHDYTNGFKTAFEERGGKLIQETYYPEGTTNMIPFLTALQQADCIVFWGTPGDCFATFPAYKELNIKMPLIQPEDGGVTSSPGMLSNLGDAAIGTVFGTAYLYTADTPGNKDFVAAYQKKYNTLPSVMSGAIYADMQVIFAALKATNGDTTPSVLHDAIKKVKTDTIRGQIYFPTDQGGWGLVANCPVLLGTITADFKIQQLLPTRDAQVKFQNGQFIPGFIK